MCVFEYKYKYEYVFVPSPGARYSTGNLIIDIVQLWKIATAFSF